MFSISMPVRILVLILWSQILWAKTLNGYLAPKEASDGPGVWVAAETYERKLSFQKEAFTDLLDFILPSPNQEEAGSCLYMATTGNVEWWLNKMKDNRKPVSDGPTDLSERFLMYLSTLPSASKVSNFLTDPVYLLNFNHQQAYLNRTYRYTKGWVKYQNGSYQKASPNESGADYSTAYNWIPEAPGPKAVSVQLPKFEREIIFKEPKGDRWAVNAMPDDIVERIKAKLRQRNAPVLVVYNHFLVWHAVLIVGYDDQESTNGCSFTNRFVDYVKKQAADAADKNDKEKAQSYLAQSQKIQKAQEAEGGCQAKGVFLVRDSIYDWADGPIYDYDPSQSGDESHYSAPIVKKEYQWIKRFGNHAIQIYPVTSN